MHVQDGRAGKRKTTGYFALPRLCSTVANSSTQSNTGHRTRSAQEGYRPRCCDLLRGRQINMQNITHTSRDVEISRFEQRSHSSFIIHHFHHSSSWDHRIITQPQPAQADRGSSRSQGRLSHLGQSEPRPILVMKLIPGTAGWQGLEKPSLDDARDDDVPPSADVGTLGTLPGFWFLPVL